MPLDVWEWVRQFKACNKDADRADEGRYYRTTELLCESKHSQKYRYRASVTLNSYYLNSNTDLHEFTL